MSNFFLSISEGVGVIVITGLEFRCGATNIIFGGAIRCDRGFVNDSLFRALSIERAVAELRQLQGGMVDFGFCLLM